MVSIWRYDCTTAGRKHRFCRNCIVNTLSCILGSHKHVLCHRDYVYRDYWYRSCSTRLDNNRCYMTPWQKNITCRYQGRKSSVLGCSDMHMQRRSSIHTCMHARSCCAKRFTWYWWSSKMSRLLQHGTFGPCACMQRITDFRCHCESVNRSIFHSCIPCTQIEIFSQTKPSHTCTKRLARAGSWFC